MKELDRRRVLIGVGALAFTAACGEKPGPTGTKTPETRHLTDREKLVRKESDAWSNFFGKDIQVPLPSKEVFKEMKMLEKHGFEAHYIPSFNVMQDANYPGWRDKPGYDFWSNTLPQTGYEGGLQSSLHPAWVMIDNTHLNTSAWAEYAHDPYASLIEDARGKDPISWNRSPTTRFYLSHHEVYKKILPRIKCRLDLPDNTAVRLPTALEYSALLSREDIKSDKWKGDAKTFEWVHETTKYVEGDYPRQFGFFSNGKTVDISAQPDPEIGFRPMIVFPD